MQSTYKLVCSSCPVSPEITEKLFGSIGIPDCGFPDGIVILYLILSESWDNSVQSTYKLFYSSCSVSLEITDELFGSNGITDFHILDFLMDLGFSNQFYLKAETILYSLHIHFFILAAREAEKSPKIYDEQWDRVSKHKRQNPRFSFKVGIFKPAASESWVNSLQSTYPLFYSSCSGSREIAKNVFLTMCIYFLLLGHFQWKLRFALSACRSS